MICVCEGEKLKIMFVPVMEGKVRVVVVIGISVLVLACAVGSFVT